MLDNYVVHKHPRDQSWLAARPRYYVHSTLAHASWLNRAEWPAEHITRLVIRRCSFRMVRGLVRRFDALVAHYNTTVRPLVWTAAADSIVTKLERPLKAIAGRNTGPAAAALLRGGGASCRCPTL